MPSRSQVTKKVKSVNVQPQQSAEVMVIQNPIWKKKGTIFYPFSTIQDENGKRNVLELNMKGSVVKSFLRAGALSHTIFIDASKEDIEALKSLIKTMPGFNEEHYRWPFEGSKIRFTSKRDLDSEFKFVWNGAGVDWNNIEERTKLAVEEVKEGTSVVIEYTPLSYLGRNGTDEVNGFENGCSLQLLSIGILDEGDSKDFDFESPRKKRRMAD
jgi:hypothetical protein